MMPAGMRSAMEGTYMSSSPFGGSSALPMPRVPSGPRQVEYQYGERLI